jgi:ubiquinone/menaquinone biosynthesis C-methylase UbiE
MKRLEKENSNTKEYYNGVFTDNFKREGLDYSDTWRVDALLEEYKGGKLLDIGCGICPLVNEAQERFNDEVWGIDFADNIITKLKVFFPQVNYAVSDFNNLFFKENYFDYVVLGEVIEHSEDPAKLITEALRVLKPKGVLSVSVPINETIENHAYEQHIWSFTQEDIEKLIPNIFYKKEIGNTFICKASKA